jgi:hypothetical protein
MGPHLVVMPPPPLLDTDARIEAVAQPLHIEAFVAQLLNDSSVAFCQGLPDRSTRCRSWPPGAIGECRGDELRAVVRPQVPRRPVQTYELSERAALERVQREKEAPGEFERECPGSCGAQDTFDVGIVKGAGRIYPQTFIDTSAKVGFAKLRGIRVPWSITPTAPPVQDRD